MIGIYVYTSKSKPVITIMIQTSYHHNMRELEIHLNTPETRTFSNFPNNDISE